DRHTHTHTHTHTHAVFCSFAYLLMHPNLLTYTLSSLTHTFSLSLPPSLTHTLTSFSLTRTHSLIHTSVIFIPRSSFLSPPMYVVCTRVFAFAVVCVCV